MNTENYIEALKSHAKNLDFRYHGIRVGKIVFRHSGTGKLVRLEPKPPISDHISYTRYAKGLITAARNEALGIPPRPSIRKSDPRHQIPTENSWDDWIFAEYPLLAPPAEMEHFVGKWMIFSPLADVDRDWNVVRQATDAGGLTFAAKVSTVRTSGDGTYVICVFTPDWRDRVDAMHWRERLRELGFTRKISYKSNEMTQRGERGSIYGA